MSFHTRRKTDKPTLPPSTIKVPLYKLRGHRFPGNDWVINSFATRGAFGYRAYEQFARNRWGDFTVDSDGMVTVAAPDKATRRG